jgi:glycosyltransferase involved in cell wall biosynthesis
VKLSVIIPTKNRQRDLLETLRALGAQTRPADELIIVDQSPADSNGTEVWKLSEAAAAVSAYIWDWTITGLPMARNVGFSASTGDIVCYLDDDTTPAPDYLARVEEGFASFPEWDGLCGRITDVLQISRTRRLAGSFFRLGIFADDRSWLVMSSAPRRARLLPGAACCFRRSVLERFSFDESLAGYALGEDVEFCLRAGRVFKFGVFPSAKVHHRRSEIARPPATELRDMARESAARLWRAHRRHLSDDACYFWLCFGLAVERVISSWMKPHEALEEPNPVPHN